MTGKGKHTAYKHDDSGMVYDKALPTLKEMQTVKLMSYQANTGVWPRLES